MNGALEAIDSLSEEKLRHYLLIIPDINSRDGPFKETLLHKAIKKRWKNGVLILMENNIDIKLTNSFGQSSLHYAVATKSVDIVRLFIERGDKNFLSYTDRRGCSALHDAASLGLEDIVDELIEADVSVHDVDSNGQTPLHNAVSSRNPNILYRLLAAGANIQATDNKNRNVLSILLSSYQDLFRSVLDLSFKEGEEKYFNETRINVNFYPLCSNNSSQLSVIREILKFGSLKLTSHPLCEAFLLLKWLSLRYYFIIDVLLYFLFTIVSTVLILNKFIWRRFEGFYYISPNSVSYNLCFTLVVIGAITMLLRHFFILIHGIKIRFFSAWYIFNFIVPVIFVIVIPGEYSPWQDHLAVIALFLSWSQGLLHIGRFPKWGIYITMFTSVANNFLRMFLIFFCVFIAFTLSFNVISFSRHSTSNETLESEAYNITLTDGEVMFSNLWIMLLKTLTMMVGELNFDSNVIEILNYLPGTSYCIYVAFIFLMSIILSNLLVALAVSDVQTLKNKAHLEKLYKQAEVAELMETTWKVISTVIQTLTFKRFLNKIYLSSITSATSHIYVHINDHMKNGCLILKKKKDIKVIYVTSNFVANVKQCLRNNQLSYEDQIDKSNDTINIASRIKKLDLQIEVLTKKLDVVLLSVSNIEKMLNKLK